MTWVHKLTRGEPRQPVTRRNYDIRLPYEVGYPFTKEQQVFNHRSPLRSPKSSPLHAQLFIIGTRTSGPVFGVPPSFTLPDQFFTSGSLNRFVGEGHTTVGSFFVQFRFGSFLLTLQPFSPCDFPPDVSMVLWDGLSYKIGPTTRGPGNGFSECINPVHDLSPPVRARGRERGLVRVGTEYYVQTEPTLPYIWIYRTLN